MVSEELHSRQMQGIKGPDGHRERIEGSRQDRRRELDVRDTVQQVANLPAVGNLESARMHPQPDLVLEEATGGEGLLP